MRLLTLAVTALVATNAQYDMDGMDSFFDEADRDADELQQMAVDPDGYVTGPGDFFRTGVRGSQYTADLLGHEKGKPN